MYVQGTSYLFFHILAGGGPRLHPPPRPPGVPTDPGRGGGSAATQGHSEPNVVGWVNFDPGAEACVSVRNHCAMPYLETVERGHPEREQRQGWGGGQVSSHVGSALAGVGLPIPARLRRPRARAVSPHPHAPARVASPRLVPRRSPPRRVAAGGD